MSSLVLGGQQSLTAAAALASHFVFKRYEPTIPQFGFVVGAVFLLSQLAASGATTLVAFLRTPITTAAQNVALYLVTLSISILYYRLFSTTHPLHALPGPLLARTSQLFIFWRVVNGQVRHDMTAMHKKYGDVVRIGPNEVSVSYPESILQIHGARAWIRGTSYNVSTHSPPGALADHASLLGLRDHATHTPRRRIWDRAFQISALVDYQPMVTQRLADLVEQFDARQGDTIDLYTWLGYFVWDVTSGLAFGGGSNFLQMGEDKTGVMESLSHSMHFQGQLMVLPWLSSVAWLIPMAAKTQGFRDFATGLFTRRYKEGSISGDKDVFHYLLGEGVEGAKEPTQSALAGDSSLVIAGGADTTRSVLTLLFMHILRDPIEYRMLRNAVDDAVKDASLDAVGQESFPTHDVLKKIPLLDAFINETLRINPPIPFEHVRESPPEGADLQGFAIPGGVNVRVASNAVQRDPRSFTDPLVFRPERWIDSKGELFNKAAFFPFLFGAFHCPGKMFAYQEMRILIATLLWKYDMAFAPGFNSQDFEQTIRDNGSLLEIVRPLDIVVTRRVHQVLP